MLTIGLTGGIGSGKSEVSRRFEALGIVVADADLAARVVVDRGQPALAAISKHFGNDILAPDGSLNRALLRQKIFANADDKAWLESLLHPLIASEIQRQLDAAQSPYSILSSPLLLETEQWRNVDRILVVDTREEVQITRSCRRDSNSETQIRSIMASQIARDERLKRAHDIIDNNGSISVLQEQVERLHRQYLCAAQ